MTNNAATIINGRDIAANLRTSLSHEVAALRQSGLIPGLAVILIGDNPASQIYVRNKVKACESIGVHSVAHHLPAAMTMDQVETLIDTLNADESIHGILLQLPLPAHLDMQRLISRIHPDKDVDGLHPINIGRLTIGDPAAVVPCTPQGIMALIRSVRTDIAGLNAVVIGRSILCGKPIAQLLLAANCTVTTAHSHSQNLAALCAQADILVAAAGHAHLVRADWVKPGAIVIDVGINRNPDGTLSGDVDFDAARTVAGAITPVPGGVGPMTIAGLLANTVTSAKKSLKSDI